MPTPPFKKLIKRICELNDVGKSHETETSLNSLLSPNEDHVRILDYVMPVGTIVYNTLTQAQMNSLYPWMSWEPYGQGRVLVGAGTSDAEYALGDEDGASSVTLTTEQTPLKKHGHSVNNASHTHTVYGCNAAGSAGNFVMGVTAQKFANSSQTTSGPSAAVSINETENTSATAHNNMPPYKVVNIWRRAA